MYGVKSKESLLVLNCSGWRKQGEHMGLPGARLC